MTSGEMTRQVNEELEHIPDWPGVHQKELRMHYNAWRRASLGKGAKDKQSANDVLQQCIAFLRKDHPDAEFLYDREFFEGRAAAVV